MKDQDTSLLEEAYSLVIQESSGKKCMRCGSPMNKHPNPEKARKGYKNCPNCDLTYSPEATVKGSYAMFDRNREKIITGVKKD